jgi:hypothetical protein
VRVGGIEPDLVLDVEPLDETELAAQAKQATVS